MAKDAEFNKPQLITHDAYGRRTNEIRTTEGWRFFKREAATEKLIAIPYETESVFARLHQVAKLYLFNPSSGMYSCPLAMTDGAAYTLMKIRK